MTTFRALVVEDEESKARTTKLLLEGFSLDDFDEWRGASPEVDIAGTQEEVDRLVEGAVSRGRPYDLLLLDLKYPKSATAKFSSEDKVYEGMEWLPEARRRLPEAAIVVYTSYPYEIAVEEVVKAILDHKANEFIPKTEPWLAVAQRLRIALRHSVDRRKAKRLAEDFQEMLESFAMRTLTEDVIAIIDNGRAPFESIARTIESGDASAIAASADRIRTTYQDIRRLALAKAKYLLGESESAQPINDLKAWLRDLYSSYEYWFEEIGANIVIEAGENIRLHVRQTELRVALLEVIFNAEHSLRESATPAGKRELRIRAAGGDGTPVTIVIEDNGDGFPLDALPDRVFEAGYTSRREVQDARRKNRHKGLGLHVAQRMMSSIGWKIEAGPAAVPPGARVTLTML